MAKAAGLHQPAFGVFFLEEKEVYRTKMNVLDKRQKQLKSASISNLSMFYYWTLSFNKIGTIYDIRSMHDFTILANHTVCCRRTSNSQQYETFSFS